MSQNPSGPNYNPYGQNPNPSNPNYPAAPGTAYGGSQPPAGSNPYAQYPPNPPSGFNQNTPNSAYSNPPYQASNPPSGPNPGEPNSNYGSYSNPYAPPPPITESNPYDPYAQTAMSQQSLSNPGYAGYNPPSMPGQLPGQTPFMPQQPQPPARKSRTGLIVFLVIALLVIIGGSIGFVSYNNNQTTLHANATATAISTQATATQQASQSMATATALANTFPFSNNLILNDPMADNSKGANWDVDKANGCFFSGSAYHITDSQANTYNPCFATHTDYTNFTFQVEVELNQGNDNSDSSLIFRANKDSNKFYRFTIDDQGGCSLLVSVDTTGANTRDLKDCSATNYNTGLGVTNTLAVVARGEQLSFYVNQQLITSVTDSTYTHGEIGLAVGNFDSKNSEAIFSNAKVWQLPS